ncbi:HD-GYP domain-containing protein [Marinobacter sp. LQ44]|uniref:HD-GYP domain-containing protein n=1 Tax=unclassified Marinobacter TaxID=83889 RepID=UPI000718ED4E|nr:HD-GYP domain-containing protein [Marinobacter sp. LQ44]AMQ89466.1 phosphohydrolase [Marinobacter sp. LQ44]
MGETIVERQVPVTDLEIGMHVVRLDRPWEETSFLLQGFIVKSESDIWALRDQCDFVYIEGREVSPASGPSKSVRNQPSKQSKTSSLFNFFGRHKGRPSTADAPRGGGKKPIRVNYINKVALGDEIGRASQFHREAKTVADSIMSGLRVGRALDLNSARKVVNQCVDSILNNTDAMLLLTKLKERDDYTAEHCMNVAILSAAFGKHLGLLEGEIRTLGLCGLLHDVGKARVPLDILQKPGALTPDEFAAMRRHADYGRDILMSSGRSLNAAVDVAYNHHERLDGKGYPRSLKAAQIPYFAKIVAIIDTYDAITSNRVYDTCRSSMTALEIIYKHRGAQFDGELAEEFIRFIGIYPPGSLVELQTGELAVVTEANPRNRLRPRVLLVTSPDKSRLAELKALDLALALADEKNALYAIKRELPDGSHGILLKELMDAGLKLALPVTESASD